MKIKEDGKKRNNMFIKYRDISLDNAVLAMRESDEPFKIEIKCDVRDKEYQETLKIVCSFIKENRKRAAVKCAARAINSKETLQLLVSSGVYTFFIEDSVNNKEEIFSLLKKIAFIKSYLSEFHWGWVQSPIFIELQLNDANASFFSNYEAYLQELKEAGLDRFVIEINWHASEYFERQKFKDILSFSYYIGLFVLIKGVPACIFPDYIENNAFIYTDVKKSSDKPQTCKNCGLYNVECGLNSKNFSGKLFPLEKSQSEEIKNFVERKHELPEEKS